MTAAILLIVAALLVAAFKAYDALLTEASTVLTGSIAQWDTILGHATTAFSTICNIIIAICVLMELAQVAAKVDIMKWEHAIKIGVKMALAKACMEIAPDFLKACYNQVTLAITALQSEYQAPTLGSLLVPVIGNVVHEVDSLGGAISLLVTTLLLILAIRVCGFLVVTLAYVRTFEILMYLLVSPLPCSVFPYGEGINRVTVRFFKGFAAVCLQGLMMYMCLRLFGEMFNTVLAGQVQATINETLEPAVKVTDLCWQMILYAVLLVMAVAKCGSWAKSIMDVA